MRIGKKITPKSVILLNRKKITQNILKTIKIGDVSTAIINLNFDFLKFKL